jgi:hypothetical protein
MRREVQQQREGQSEFERERARPHSSSLHLQEVFDDLFAVRGNVPVASRFAI